MVDSLVPALRFGCLESEEKSTLTYLRDVMKPDLRIIDKILLHRIKV